MWASKKNLRWRSFSLVGCIVYFNVPTLCQCKCIDTHIPHYPWGWFCAWIIYFTCPIVAPTQENKKQNENKDTSRWEMKMDDVRSAKLPRTMRAKLDSLIPESATSAHMKYRFAFNGKRRIWSILFTQLIPENKLWLRMLFQRTFVAAQSYDKDKHHMYDTHTHTPSVSDR